MNKKLTTEEFIQKSRRIHKDKFDYSKSIYGIRNTEKVIIICPTHGEFLQSPAAHFNGQGCKECRDEYFNSINKLDVNKFIKQSLKIHGNRYNYSKVDYINNRKKVVLICKLHGEFYQPPFSHLSGCGCPKCKSSKGELQISRFLKDNSIIYETQKTFDNCVNPKTNYKFRFDFYIPAKNLLIEYDGEHHFNCGGFVNRKYKIVKSDVDYAKYKDKIKTQYAKKNGIELLRIKYTDFNKINVILSSVLNA